ncbi:hypothetical protein ACRC7T_14935 [Segnochrobactraceae bacterium EtOH-i3]
MTKARGRRRKAGVARTATGRPSRARTRAGVARVIDRARDRIDMDPMRTVLATRCRLYGLTEAEARLPEAGYPLGRLMLAGFITREQHDAALAWLKARNAWLSAIDAKRLYREHAPEVASDQSHEEFCAAAIRRWKEISGEIEAACREKGLAPAVVARMLEEFLTEI